MSKTPIKPPFNNKKRLLQIKSKNTKILSNSTPIAPEKPTILDNPQSIDTIFFTEFLDFAQREKIHISTTNLYALQQFTVSTCPKNPAELIYDLFREFSSTLEELSRITTIPVKELFLDLYETIIDYDNKREESQEPGVPDNMTLTQFRILINFAQRANGTIDLRKARKILITYYVIKINCAHFN